MINKANKTENISFPRGLELPASLRTAPAQPAQEARPYIGHASPKTGTSGGSVSWRDLSDAGINVGQPFLLFQGEIFPASNLPCLLLGAKLVAEVRNKSSHKREEMVAIASAEEIQDIECTAQQYLRCAWHSLVLVCGVGDGEGVVASYSERLSGAVGYRSTAVGPWLAAVRDSQTPAWAAKHPQAAGLPPLVRVHARIVGAVKISRAGNEYTIPRTLVAPTTDVRVLNAIANALQGVDVPGEIQAWEQYYANLPATTPVDADEIPF